MWPWEENRQEQRRSENSRCKTFFPTETFSGVFQTTSFCLCVFPLKCKCRDQCSLPAHIHTGVLPEVVNTHCLSSCLGLLAVTQPTWIHCKKKMRSRLLFLIHANVMLDVMNRCLTNKWLNLRLWCSSSFPSVWTGRRPIKMLKHDPTDCAWKIFLMGEPRLQSWRYKLEPFLRSMKVSAHGHKPL